MNPQIKIRLTGNIFLWISILCFSSMITFRNWIGLESFGFIDDMFRFWSILITSVYFFLAFFLIKKKKYKPSRLAVLIIGMYLYLMIVTLLNGQSVVTRGLLSNTGMVLIFDIILYRKDLKLFRSSLHVLNTLAILNFLTILLFHDSGGIALYTSTGTKAFNTYLLGYDNGHIIMLLPVICFNLMLYMTNKKRKYLLLVCIPIVGVFITFSATSMVMLVLAGALYGIYRLAPALKKLLYNKTVLIISFIFVFVFFILMRGYSSLSALLRSLFQKDIGSAREILYQISLSYIGKKWIFGYGFLAHRDWISGYNSGHNIFLNFLLAGGVTGLLWFLYILYNTFRSAERIKDGSKEAMLLFCCIVAFVAAAFTEGYDTYNTFYLFYCLCLSLYHWDTVKNFLGQYDTRRIKVTV